MKNKKILTAKLIYGLLLVLWMGVIFYMSSRTSDESSRASTGITKFISEVAVSLRIIDEKDITPVFISGLHKWIRTFAHYFEYLVLGIISFQYLKQFQLRKIIHVGMFSLLFCISYAVSDEIHQYFVPGRTMDILDVLTDSLGSLTGIVLMYLISKSKKQKVNSHNTI